MDNDNFYGDNGVAGDQSQLCKFNFKQFSFCFFWVLIDPRLSSSKLQEIESKNDYKTGEVSERRSNSIAGASNVNEQADRI